MAKVELPTGIVIDADNPVMHDYPSYCSFCETVYYFRHFCFKDAESIKPGKISLLAKKGRFFE